MAQVGGIGILERLNRTFKHEFVFHHEVNTLADLKALLPAFQYWYNKQRLHSRSEYRPPAAVLVDKVVTILFNPRKSFLGRTRGIFRREFCEVVELGTGYLQLLGYRAHALLFIEGRHDTGEIFRELIDQGAHLGYLIGGGKNTKIGEDALHRVHSTPHRGN